MRPIVFASLAFFAFTGCNQSPLGDRGATSSQESAGLSNSEEQAPSTTPSSGSSSAGSDNASFNLLMENEHYRLGNQYFKERKFFSPEGGNATESFLAARRSFGSPQEGIEQALKEMEPYLIIAVERAQSDRDRSEATRLLNLLKIINANAPAIPRLEQQMFVLGGTAMVAPSSTSPLPVDLTTTPALEVIAGDNPPPSTPQPPPPVSQDTP